MESNQPFEWALDPLNPGCKSPTDSTSTSSEASTSIFSTSSDLPDAPVDLSYRASKMYSLFGSGGYNGYLSLPSSPSYSFGQDDSLTHNEGYNATVSSLENLLDDDTSVEPKTLPSKELSFGAPPFEVPFPTAIGSEAAAGLACVGCVTARANSRCYDCRLSLCGDCFSSHLRTSPSCSRSSIQNLNLPADELISCDSNLVQNGIRSNPVSPTIGKEKCGFHSDHDAPLYCIKCSNAICLSCIYNEHATHEVAKIIEIVQSSKLKGREFITNAKKELSVLGKEIKNARNNCIQLEKNMKAASINVDAFFDKMKEQLEDYKKEMVKNIQISGNIKRQILASLMKEMNDKWDYLHTLLNSTDSVLAHGTDMQIVRSAQKLSTYRPKPTPNHLQIVETADMSFVPPDKAIFFKFLQLGQIDCGAYGPFCDAEGEGLKAAVPGRDAFFVVRVRNHAKESAKRSHPIKVIIETDEGRQLRANTNLDKNNFNYNVDYKPRVEGRLTIHVTLYGRPIKDSPFVVTACSNRNQALATRNDRGKAIGTLGAGPGEVCRPWGICCDRQGRLLVVDRSNNRVQYFTGEGEYIKEFGTLGNKNGQLDRPAGITIDHADRIIVVDKDNHRIQIFDSEGNFLLKFGDKGTRNGQFSYPWDVASNSVGQIVVSDTRNHRIQLFSSTGKYLHKYGNDTPASLKIFDAPRGVCFDCSDNLLVSDFNHHRIVIFDALNLVPKCYIGGPNPTSLPVHTFSFCRPQGICFDKLGNLVVADSKNNRIQVISPDFKLLGIIGGSGGSALNQMDRPSGICVLPSGKIATVDFGNDRIMVW